MANINIRTDENVKRAAEELFNQLGIPMSVAINMFLRQSIRENGIPFEISLNPNETTIKALEESDKIAKDKDTKTYNDVNELRSALNI